MLSVFKTRSRILSYTSGILKWTLKVQVIENEALTANQDTESVKNGTLGCLHREIDNTFSGLHDIKGLCLGADNIELRQTF